MLAEGQARVDLTSRKIFGAGMPSKEVWMRFPMPRDTRAYDTLLSSPVRFSAPDYGILLRPEVLEMRPREADPALASLIGRQAESMLSNMRRETTCDEVRRAVTEELRSGAPAMHRIARRLATTPSTLRRRLLEEGVRYKDLLESARRELVEHLTYALTGKVDGASEDNPINVYLPGIKVTIPS